MFDPRAQLIGQAISNLLVSLVIGMIGAMFAISFASLIFTGDLAPFLPAGVAIALFSSIVSRIIVGLMSSYEGVISDTDALASAILGLCSTAIATNMVSSASPDEMFITVVGAIALSSVLTGGFLLLLGLFNVGELIRFIPYPVIGGFLAGSGWLLVQGSIQVMTDVPLTFANVGDLFQLTILPLWVSGLAIAVILLWVSLSFSQVMALPLALFLSIGLFYGVLFVSQTSLTSATANGWLVALPATSSVWHPLTVASIAQVNWSIVFAQGGIIATLILLCTISVLLNSTGIELLIARDLNLNRELRAAGVANLLVGLGSGMVGYPTLPDSALMYKMGINSRGFVLLTTVPFFAAMVAGSSILSVFPKPVLGGLLLFLGLSLLKEWLYDTRPILPKADYGIVVVIFGVMVTAGFLWGIGVGLVVAIALFVVNYSQINVAKHALSGATYPSHAARSVQQQRLLRTEGDQIYILELQGFLFFGTANTLLNHISSRLYERPLKFVVFSFQAVTGLDSSAALSFIKLKQIAQHQQLSLVFTCLAPNIQHQLEQRNLLQPDDSICQQFPDLDRGIEWCENQILDTIPQRRRRSLPLVLQLNEQFSNPGHASDVMAYLEEQDFEPGDVLFHQGDVADSLYLIEVGHVTIQQLSNGQTHRLHSLGPGNLVGEMDFFSRSPHHAAAVVDQPSRLYRLSHNALQRMQRDQPDVAATFQEWVILILSDRLSAAYKEVSDLLA